VLYSFQVIEHEPRHMQALDTGPDISRRQRFVLVEPSVPASRAISTRNAASRPMSTWSPSSAPAPQASRSARAAPGT